MQSVDSEVSPISSPPPSTDGSTLTLKASIPSERVDAPMVTSSPENSTSKPSTTNDSNAATITTTTSNAAGGDYGIKRTIIVSSSKEVGSRPESVQCHTISVLGAQMTKPENPVSVVPMSSIPTLVGNNRGSRPTIARPMSNHQPVMHNRRSPMYGIQTIPVLSGMGHPVTNQPTSMAPNVFVSSNQPQVM